MSDRGSITDKLDQKRRQARSRMLGRMVWFGGGTLLVVLILYIVVGPMLAPPPIAPVTERFVRLFNESPQLALDEFLDGEWSQRPQPDLEALFGTTHPRLGEPFLTRPPDSRDMLIRLITRLKGKTARATAHVMFPVEGSLGYVQANLRCDFQHGWTFYRIWTS